MTKRKARKKKMNLWKKIAFIFAGIIFILVIAALSAVYLWNQSSILNKEKIFLPHERNELGVASTPQISNMVESTPEPQDSSPATYDLLDDGHYYRKRQDVVTVLFMGIDSANNRATDRKIVNGTNQADTLLLGIFYGEGKVKILQIPRDTEADVKIFDMEKHYVSTERVHICLQHAYGDGGEMSCELTMDAVSNLLFGIQIDRYVSLGTKGLEKAVNAVGGVEMTMEEDFSFYSKSMKLGETLRLNGRRAMVYIRSRSNEGLDGTDQSRMKRQVQFIQAFVKQIKEQPSLLLPAYNAVKDYLQTDLTTEELLFLANQGLSGGWSDDILIRLPGTVGAEYQPFFHMDEAGAKKLIIQLFYEEIPSVS